MSHTFITGAGAVLSADIAVPDHERELRFYTRVLNTGDDPLWRDDLANSRGMPIIGLGMQNAEMAHLPLQWMPHIQVPDVAAAVARASALGGSVLMQDTNHPWAVIQDPQGAAFGVIPVVDALPESANAEGPTGRIAWLDITVADAPRIRDFYGQVVGWSPQDVPMKDGDHAYADYNMVGASGTPLAGVCHARGSNASLPPVWMIYLPVGDLAESLRRVEEEGGKVLKASRGADGSPRYAVIVDPLGVAFALVPGTM